MRYRRIRDRRRLLATAPILAAVAVAAVATGCVPPPAGFIEPSAADTAEPSPTSTPTFAPIPTGPTPEPSFVRPTLTPEPSFQTYTVRRGDTLLSIARRFNTTARSLAFWNRDTYHSLDPDSAAYAPDRIQIGWVLRLHPDVVLDPEDLATPSPSSTPSPVAS